VIKDCEITKILEIKCPIKCKNKPIFNAELGKCEIGYLEKVKNEVCLKKSHQYYTQIQVQMYVSGATMCGLFVYCPCGSIVVEVHKDDDFLSELIPELQSFYFLHYLPAIRQNAKST
jgi:hypothetical protein